MRHFEEDFETEAIEKCSRALSRLDDRAKIRVVKYLLDKFGLIAETESKKTETPNTVIHNQQNNLVLAEPKDLDSLSNGNTFLNSNNVIALKDILIKNLAKTEPELLIVIGYYNSQFGKSTFTRQSILDSFRDNNIMSENRRKNLGQNLNSLIKKSQISSITDDELSITPDGIEYAKSILSGSSQTKKRKPRAKKLKTAKQSETLNDESEIDE